MESDVNLLMTNRGREPRLRAAPARIAALEALVRVENQPALGSGEALDQAIREQVLDPRDARLATAIVYGVLRHAFWLDFQYAPFLRRDPSTLDGGLRLLFRMAACQRFLLERIPPHAIASDSVELARHLNAGRQAVGFVNAVVRRIVAQEEPRMPSAGDSVALLAIRHSHPEWLVRLYLEKFGREAGERILATNNEEAPVTLRANRLTAGPAADLARALEAEGIATRPGEVVPEALALCESGMLRPLVSSPLFEAGAFYLQDEASQVVAHLACPRPGERILDLCSAPGGKATHMAELAGGQARITATDLSGTRLQLVRENAERLRTHGLEVREMRELEETERPGAEGGFDLVLVDAPCSGLGTLRRNPEIRYRCSPKMIRRLAAEQGRILRKAAALVRPGGRIVYSTCTVTDRENRQVIESFLREVPGFSLSESETEVDAIRRLRRGDGLYRTWPDHLILDGFEAAVLKREG